jgi:Flp pilus assembly pilin Flp
MKNLQIKKLLAGLLREEQGQDLVEYTLLLAFVCLASAALFIGAGQQMSGIWNGTNNLLVQANAAASGGGGGGTGRGA